MAARRSGARGLDMAQWTGLSTCELTVKNVKNVDEYVGIETLITFKIIHFPR